MTQSQKTSDQTQNEPKKKKRRILKTVLFLFIVLIVSVLLFPTLLSGPFKGIIVSQINNQLNGKVSIGSMSLSWFGSQQVNGFKITDMNDRLVLDIKQIDFPDVSLMSLVLGNRNFGEILVDIHSIYISQDDDGTNNLQRLAKTSDKSNAEQSSHSSNITATSDSSVVTSVSKMIPQGMAANIKLRIDELSFSTSSSLTQLTDTNMNVAVAGGKPVIGTIASQMTHGPLRGSVNSDFEIDELADLSGTQIKLDVTPKAWAEFATQSKAKLLSPFGVSLSINQLKLPALAGASGLNHLVADLSLAISKVKLKPENPQFGTLELNDANFIFKANGTSNPVNIVLNGKVTQNAQAGNFDLQIKLENLLAEISKTKPDLTKIKSSIAGEIQNLGLVIFDELLQTNGLIQNAVGPTLTASINSQMQYDASGIPQGNVTLKANGQNLNVDLALKVGPNGVSQTIPGRLAVQVTPALIASAMKLSVGEYNPLTQPFVAQLGLNHISVPRVNNQWQIDAAELNLVLDMQDIKLVCKDNQLVTLSKSTWQIISQSLGTQIDINGSLYASQQGGKPGQFSLDSTVKNLFDSRSKLNIQSATFQSEISIKPWEVPETVAASSTSVNALLKQIVGTKQLIKLTGKLMDDPNVNTVIPNMVLHFKTSSQAIKTDINATLKNDLLELASGSSLSVRVTPKLVELLTAKDNAQSSFGLAGDVTFNGKIDTLRWPLFDEGQGQASVGLSVTADRIEPTGLPNNLKASIRDLSLKIGPANPAEKLPVVLTAKMYEGEQLAGNLNLGIHLLNLFSKPSAENLQVNIQNIPIALVDTLTGMKGKMYAMLGDRLQTLAMTTQGPLDKDMSVKIVAKSEMLDVAMNAHVTPEQITVQSGSKVQLKITPASLGAVMVAMNPDLVVNPPLWLLTSPATLDFTINQLNLPIDSKKLKDTQIDLAFTASDLAFIQRELKTPLLVRDLKVLANAKQLSQPVVAQITAMIFSKNAQGKTLQSSINSKTTIKHLVNASGAIDPAHAVIHTDTQIPQLPVDLLDDLTGQQGKMASMIGPSAAIKLRGNYPGQFDFDIKSKNISVMFPAHIDVHRNLTLKQNAVITMEVNEDTAKSLLQYGNPILIDATGSREPVKITVYAKNFVMPLANFEIKKLSADMDIELGTITLNNSWLLSGMGDLAAKIDRSLSMSQKQEAKFTKLSIKIRKGVTTTNDMWMQMDNVSLFGKSRFETFMVGMAGRIDIAKGYVDMGMALPAETIYSFGKSFKKYIPADSIFEIPIQGPTGQVKMKNLDKLGIQLAATIAGGELAGGKLGGWGALLGQVAGSALSGGDTKQFETKKTWPNKPVYTAPKQQTQEEVKNTQPQKTTQQLKQTEQPKKKSDKEKLRDALRGLFGN